MSAQSPKRGADMPVLNPIERRKAAEPSAGTRAPASAQRGVLPMSFWSLLLLAVGLSMDAFAVAVCKGLATRKLDGRKMVTAGLWFGGFQALMPLLGYLLGSAFERYITAFDHWIAFILLGLIGANMIRESRSKEVEEVDASYAFRPMLIMAIATSIDALAVGVSLAALDIRITTAASFIACVTFLCCVAGHAIGAKFGKILGNWAQIFGGVILVGIGSKILIEHLFF